MRLRTKRVVVSLLALSAAYVGLWAAAAPHAFFTTFPLPGHPWVSALGVYNEHLTRDVGGLYLALLVTSAWAAARPTVEVMRLAGCSWLAFGIPHLTFHMFHLDVYGTADQVGNVVALGGTVVLAALLLLPEPTPEPTTNGAE
jgi:hypothetical protein